MMPTKSPSKTPAKGKMRPRFLWEMALAEVQSRILVECNRSAMTRPQKQTLLAIYEFCCKRIKEGPPSSAPTNGELAQKYGVSLRTVTNWRREGCPLGKGQVKVLNWLSTRRYAPAGTRKKFGRQLAKREDGPATYRMFRAVLDQSRQFKRDCLARGLEPPSWTKGFRATRQTKGIPTGKRAKGQQQGGKGGKSRPRISYGLKFLAEASKVVAAMQEEDGGRSR